MIKENEPYSLHVKRLSKSYEVGGVKVNALSEVSFDVHSGEVVALHGASGSGKSTLLYSIAGLVTPDSGEMRLAESNLVNMKSAELTAYRARHVGLVFQDFRLVPYLDVLGNVMLAARGLSKPEAREHALAWLEKLGMKEKTHHKPKQLSAGEQQRCALARAMVNEPEIVLADEPTGNLDDKNSNAVLEFLTEYADSGKLVLIATHDKMIVDGVKRAFRMENGKLHT